MREGSVNLSDGRRLGYAEHGDPDGAPVLHCHGVPGGRALTLDPAALAECGARLVSVERPGFGLSDPRPGRVLLDAAADVAELADALGFDRFAVYGGSLGAPTALACAHALGDRVRVVGLACGVGPVFDQPRFDPVLPAEWQALLPLARQDLDGARELVRAFVAPTAEAWAADPDAYFDTFVAEAAELDRPGMLADRDMWAAVLDATYRRGPDVAADEILASVGPWGFTPAEVTVPVHLWHGDHDDTSPVEVARFVADELPDGHLTVYPGEGHYLAETHHRVWIDTLLGRGDHRPTPPTSKGTRPMTAHTNETATRAAFEAFAAGDLDAIRAFFTDDVTWHQGGNDALTGDYHGIDAVIGLLTKQFELSNGTVHAELLDVHATDTRTVAIERVTATRNGAILDTIVPLVFDGTDGRAREVWSHVFADPAEYAAFWGPAE